MRLRIIITGTTGMVGEGVLHESLQHPLVESVLSLSRKPCGLTHPKLKEILLPDFFNLTAIEKDLAGYNACFFCLGISSLGVKEEDYYRTTYSLTLNMAEKLSRLNPGMTFCYISGAGTDSSERGKIMWARIKGKTENDLIKLPYLNAFAFRPGFIKPIPGMSHTNPLYKYLGWIYPIGRALYAKGFCTLPELALSMIQVAQSGAERRIIDGKYIPALAKENLKTNKTNTTRPEKT